jgi:hypothetical protein
MRQEIVMKSIFALAAAGLLALSAPAFAQTVGAPGATGARGGLTGGNTGTGAATPKAGATRMKHAAPRM